MSIGEFGGLLFLIIVAGTILFFIVMAYLMYLEHKDD